MAGFQKRLFSFAIFTAIGVGLAAGARLLAQAPATSGAAGPLRGDSVSELLVEVRALRAEIGEAARTSFQSQLLVSRLQLQEQRLFHLDRQRAEIAARRADAERALSAFESQLKPLEDGLVETPNRENAEFVALVVQKKAQQAMIDQLRSQESELVNGIGAEQARWSDFNGRLDELERSMGVKR